MAYLKVQNQISQTQLGTQRERERETALHSVEKKSYEEGQSPGEEKSRAFQSHGQNSQLGCLASLFSLSIHKQWSLPPVHIPERKARLCIHTNACKHKMISTPHLNPRERKAVRVWASRGRETLLSSPCGGSSIGLCRACVSIKSSAHTTCRALQNSYPSFRTLGWTAELLQEPWSSCVSSTKLFKPWPKGQRTSDIISHWKIGNKYGKQTLRWPE